MKRRPVPSVSTWPRPTATPAVAVPASSATNSPSGTTAWRWGFRFIAEPKRCRNVIAPVWPPTIPSARPLRRCQAKTVRRKMPSSAVRSCRSAARRKRIVNGKVSTHCRYPASGSR